MKTWRNRIVFLCLIVSAAALRGAELTVFAAASLTDVMNQIGAAYEKADGGKVVFNFAGSNVLERQIAAGAPADLFISADEAKMDTLAKLDAILPETRHRLLSNGLVVVGLKGSSLRVTALSDLAGPAVHRLALADPQAVPAGIYARECLQRAGLWEQVRDRVVPTVNVRAALSAVESGNVDAGIVYRTDAAISKKVSVLWVVPPDQSPPISYPVAVVKGTRNPAKATAFEIFLSGAEASAIFQRFGFITETAPAAGMSAR